MKIVAQAQDIPNGAAMPGARGTVTRQDDGAIVVTDTTDADGWVALQANGAPGNIYLDYLRGTDRFRQDSRSMRPYGAFDPAEFQGFVAEMGDGVLPYGSQFAVGGGGNVLTVGTGAVVLNGVVGVWYTSTNLTVGIGARACAVRHSGTGVLQMQDVAVADLTADDLPLYTYTGSEGGIASITNVMTPFLSAINSKNPVVQAIARDSGLGTSSASGLSVLQLDLVLVSGVAYDIEASASGVTDTSGGSWTRDGAIGLRVDGDVSAYVSSGGDVQVTLVNSHTISKTGGTCTVEFMMRRDAVSGLFGLSSMVLFARAIPRS